ncbi:uncharacterized protein KY384_007098 [Bacidia gigantensis]|uniref:uncharacterized protein n=1 Tax=Bacidia gigantensis TaxID=2732470 RepID=UPI001D04DFEE|nr:uncharacterized protein KY384_007098 [Bacidia gigantensis]KAG8528181.1 hypothetical protein KY384_007098 [Bacidia gigantensis]
MVNLEPGRDYYADLEITPQANANDVKKQFKKLALKYHPDRNPGQEAEYNAKFQAISAANEVLTDPALRAKFDAQRFREGPPRPFSNPQTRPDVPPRTRATNFPPPPRAPPPPASKPQPSSGARRYDNFARANAGWGATDTDDVRGKANDFKAWEQMRHGQGPLPKSRPPPSRSPRRTTFEPKHTSPPGRASNGPTSRVRRTWEDLKDAGMPYLGKTQSNRPAGRKSGPEDEKQTQSAFSNTFNGDHPTKSPEMAPPPRPRHAVPPRHDPANLHGREHVASSNHTSARPRMQYKNAGGERTFLASPAIHRSATTATPRDARDQTGFKDRRSANFNGDHHHSASAGAATYEAPFRSSNVSSATTSATTSSDDEDEEPFYGKAPEHREHRIPRSRKARMPAGAGIRMRSGFSPHVHDGNQDEGQAPHPGYADFRRHSGIDLPTQSSFSDQPGGFAAHRTRQDSFQNGPQSAKSPANDSLNDRFPQRHKSFDDSFEMPDHSKPSTTTSPRDSPSSEAVNMRFSVSGSPPKFGNHNPFSHHKATAEDGENADEFLDDEETSPTDTRVPNEREAGTDIPPPPKVGDKWSAEDWERRFGVHTFDIPASGPNSRATSRKRSGTPKSSSLNNLRRTAFRSSGFQPTVADDSDEPSASEPPPTESLNRSTNNSRTSNASDGSAMDIDSTPPASSNSKPVKTGQASPLGTHRDSQSTVTASPPKTNGDSQRLNLGDFRHVAPFATNQSGLNGIGDLNDFLPFESRPSPIRPDFTKCTKPLELPKPPKAPSPPQTLNDETWNTYVEKMNWYLFHWNSFNQNMILLFQQRQEDRREIGPSWIVQMGGDCEAYLECLKEEEKARKWWDVATDYHKESMTNLKNVRERVLKAKGQA